MRLPLTASLDVLLSTTEVRDKAVGARGECGVLNAVLFEGVGDFGIFSSRFLFRPRLLSFCVPVLAVLASLGIEDEEDIAFERIAVERKREGLVK